MMDLNVSFLPSHLHTKVRINKKLLYLLYTKTKLNISDSKQTLVTSAHHRQQSPLDILPGARKQSLVDILRVQRPTTFEQSCSKHADFKASLEI